MYELRQSPMSNCLPWKIGDTMGMTAGTINENEVRNILHIVAGRVPEGYAFGEKESFHQNSSGYNPNPSVATKIHCVAIVLCAETFMKISFECMKKLQSLRQGLKDRGIPTYAILTGIDEICCEVKFDAARVYHSKIIRDLVSAISKKLLDFPKKDILPVVNYSEQIEVDNNIDILLLHALRQMTGAKERECQNMKREIAGLVPKQLGFNLPFYNIFLVGQIGSGKSTFFNGINAILKERFITTMAEAGEKATSLTKEFRMYRIQLLDKNKTLSTRICDTRGLKDISDGDIDVRNALSAIDGHVPDKYEFTENEFHQDSPGYIASPQLENRAHCVCVVIDAEKAAHMPSNMWRKLRSICMALKERGIPTRILLAKIDLVLDLGETIENIDKHEAVLQLKKDIVQELNCDIKEDDIFHIKNYVTEVEFDVDVDFLLLRSLRRILTCAQGYLSRFGKS